MAMTQAESELVMELSLVLTSLLDRNQITLDGAQELHAVLNKGY